MTPRDASAAIRAQLTGVTWVLARLTGVVDPGDKNFSIVTP